MSKTVYLLLFVFITLIIAMCASNWWLFSTLRDTENVSDKQLTTAKSISAIYASVILLVVFAMTTGIFIAPLRHILIKPRGSKGENLFTLLVFVVVFLVLLTIDVMSWYMFVSLNKKNRTERDISNVKTVSMWSAISITVIFALVIITFITKAVIKARRKKKNVRDDSVAAYTSYYK